MTKFSLHVCSPWSGDCRMHGIRLNFWLPGYFLIVALTPGGRVARADGRSSWVVLRRK